MMTNNDRRVPDHPLLGLECAYRPDLPDLSGEPLTDPMIVVRPGDKVIVLAAFHTWNGVPNLDMLYVSVPATGYRTHVTPADLGVA